MLQIALKVKSNIHTLHVQATENTIYCSISVRTETNDRDSVRFTLMNIDYADCVLCLPCSSTDRKLRISQSANLLSTQVNKNNKCSVVERDQGTHCPSSYSPFYPGNHICCSILLVVPIDSNHTIHTVRVESLDVSGMAACDIVNLY